jgi:hypothetical protein
LPTGQSEQIVLETSLNRPGAQERQEPGGFDGLEELMVPTGHNEQVDMPATLNFPAGQMSHDSEALPLYVPTMQPRQVVAVDALYLPGMQLLQKSEALPEYVPPAHESHLDASSLALNLPLGHSEQTTAFAAL